MTLRNSKGFTLVEILVAVLVIGAGLMMAARMQLIGIQNTQGGYLRAQAANLSYEIIDRMRTNIVGLSAGDYDMLVDDDSPTEITCGGATANCTPAQMAQYDNYWWRQTISRALPSGTGSIATTDSGDFTTVTVSMSWVDPYSAADGNEQTIIMAELPQ
jgi:type IV pilus assembly protein PilV